MKSNCNCKKPKGIVAFGLTIIIIGLIILLSSTGIIPTAISENIFCWQSILVIVGIFMALSKNFFSGFVLILTGFYYSPMLQTLVFKTSRTPVPAEFWSIILIAIGVKMIFFRKKCRKTDGQDTQFKSATINNEDGFINSNSTFGASEYIVLSPLFKGATIRNVFSGTKIDLRKTSIEGNEVVVDIDCVFSGIEIYIPAEWHVVFDTYNVMSATKDKRYHNQSSDGVKSLIIRGKLVFSEIAVK